jgi:hypothetical protein
MALWTLGAVPFLVWFLWCTVRYRSARGRPMVVSPSEMFGDDLAEEMSANLRRQHEPRLESLRRRVWVALGLWFAYIVFGASFWSALVGR